MYTDLVFIASSEHTTSRCEGQKVNGSKWDQWQSILINCISFRWAAIFLCYLWKVFSKILPPDFLCVEFEFLKPILNGEKLADIWRIKMQLEKLHLSLDQHNLFVIFDISEIRLSEIGKRCNVKFIYLNHLPTIDRSSNVTHNHKAQLVATRQLVIRSS